MPSFAIDFTYVPDKELLVAVETTTLFFVPITLPKNPNATDVVAAIHCNLTMCFGAPHTITHDADCLFQTELQAYADVNGINLRPIPIRAHTTHTPPWRRT